MDGLHADCLTWNCMVSLHVPILYAFLHKARWKEASHGLKTLFILWKGQLKHILKEMNFDLAIKSKAEIQI